MFQTLYTYPENWRAFKAQIAAQYSGASLKVASAAPAFTFGQTNRSPVFLKNFPLGKVCNKKVSRNALQNKEQLCWSALCVFVQFCCLCNLWNSVLYL